MTKKIWMTACAVVLAGILQAAVELPAGWKSLAWVESTGLQYVDTGVVHTPETRIDCRVLVRAHQPGPWAALFGSRVHSHFHNCFTFFSHGMKTDGGTDPAHGIYNRTKVLAHGPEFPYGKKVALTCAGRAATWTVEGSGATGRIETPAVLEGGKNTLFIFNLNTAGENGKLPDTSPACMRLYSFKISEGEKCVRDFMPCRQANGKVGLWDRVEGKFYGNAAGYGEFVGCTVEDRWPLEKAQAWGKRHPWYCGVNYLPANAINDTAIWDKTTFSPELIRREFALARRSGINCVRVFLQYKVYEDDPAWFRGAFESFLMLAADEKLKVMPALFDDCSFGVAEDPVLGKQTEPIIGWYSWGWTPSPGHTMVVDEREHAKLEMFVRDLIRRHRDDERIFVWDLYNEPTNAKAEGFRSIALAQKCFAWAREENPSQPLSIGVWNGNGRLNEILRSESDIITFHSYGAAASIGKMIAGLATEQRPIVCTEWMCRHHGCTIKDCLGVFTKTHTGCILWGLVNGKTQTHLTWGDRPGHIKNPTIWQHDLFHGDHTPYDPEEIKLLRQAEAKMNARPQAPTESK